MENFVPRLSAGSHTSPEDGACIMEMVSFLAGEEWSDLPSCTNTTLARVAQRVNDSVEDRNRHLILKDFDRLFNTRVSFTQERIYTDEIIPLFRRISSLEGEKTRLLFAGNLNDDGIDTIDREIVYILTESLDIYDSMFGRESIEEQDLSKLKELSGVK